MSDHIPDPTKMIQDTPRTDEQINGKPCTRFTILAGDCLRNAAVPSEFARTLERELNAANAIIRQQQLLDEENLQLQERIKRLEEAGNNLLWNFCPEYTSDLTQEQSDALKQWNKAKEAKP